MIAKRIERDGRPSSYGKLARYVVDARGRENPASWSRTTDYILDSEHEGAKVGGVRVTNCDADEPAMAALEILATQGQNTRSKKDKTYHLVVSFAPGENPSLATIHAIEDALCEAIGLPGHQRISAIHTDTDHLHVHVAINKVNPTTFRNVEPFYDKARLMEACARLEVEHGLVRTNHGLERDLTRPRSQEQHHDERTDHPTRASSLSDRERAFLRQSYHAAVAEEPQAESLNAVRSLSSVGLVCDPEADAVLLQGDAPDELAGRRAARDPGVRRVRDGDGGSRSETAGSVERAGGRPGDMEAHSGRESLAGWIKRDVSPALANAASWQELHGALAKHGLVLEARGAGLVLRTADGQIGVKASSIGRSWSKGSLEARMGAFRPATASVRRIESARSYRASPKQDAAGGLFAQFQRERDQAIAQRASERARLREAHASYKTELAAYYGRRRAAVRSSRMQAGQKMAAYQAMAAERASDWTKQRQIEAAQRANLARANPLPVWQEWLTAKAAAGDLAAIAALRSRARTMERMVDALFGPNGAGVAAARAELKPKADKHGTLTYQLQDGGSVRDGAAGIAVDKRTDASAALAVALAAERFAGQVLDVEGSREFRMQVAKIAGSKKLNVVFADAELEASRLEARGGEGKGRPPAPSPSPATVEASPVAELVAARNADRVRVASILEHREWRTTDAGGCEYEGRRALRDGSQALLLRKDGMMLVMAATPAQVAAASTWKKGRRVDVGRDGRISAGREPKRGLKR